MPVIVNVNGQKGGWLDPNKKKSMFLEYRNIENKLGWFKNCLTNSSFFRRFPTKYETQYGTFENSKLRE